MLKALAEHRWGDLQGVSRLRSWHVEDLTEHVREPMWPVQALEHAERASDLHFLGQQRPLGVHRPVRREAFGEVVGEASKVRCRRSTGLFFTSRM